MFAVIFSCIIIHLLFSKYFFLCLKTLLHRVKSDGSTALTDIGHSLYLTTYNLTTWTDIRSANLPVTSEPDQVFILRRSNHTGSKTPPPVVSSQVYFFIHVMFCSQHTYISLFINKILISLHGIIYTYPFPYC